MSERGIIMQAESVRAIIAGRKTQTRRVVTAGRGQEWLSIQGVAAVPSMRTVMIGAELWAQMDHPHGGPGGCVRCPYGAPGDRLWVKEAWTRWCSVEGCDKRGHIAYRADASAEVERMTSWRSPMSMPRWASRLTLEVVEVRVQRVQDLTVADAEAEGIDPAPHAMKPSGLDMIDAYRTAWDALNAKRGFAWASNPWVWAVTFKRVEAV